MMTISLYGRNREMYYVSSLVSTFQEYNIGNSRRVISNYGVKKPA